MLDVWIVMVNDGGVIPLVYVRALRYSLFFFFSDRVNIFICNSSSGFEKTV